MKKKQSKNLELEILEDNEESFPGIRIKDVDGQKVSIFSPFFHSK